MLGSYLIFGIAAYLTVVPQGVRSNDYGSNQDESSTLRLDDNYSEADPPHLMNGSQNEVLDANNTMQAKDAIKSKLPPYLQLSEKYVTIHYVLYKRGGVVRTLKKEPKIKNDKEIYVLIPGLSNGKQKSYVDDFHKLLSSAILDHCDCYVMGVKWTVKTSKQEDVDLEYKAAILVGAKLAGVINKIRRATAAPEAISIISHDLGNLVTSSTTNNVEVPVDYIYGLDQMELEGPFRDYYLRQDSGNLVQTITTQSAEFNYGHRNFYPNGGYIPSDSDCSSCQSYKLLAEDIRQNGKGLLSTFCSSYDDYELDMCGHFQTVSLFNRIPANHVPTGNYFV